MNFTEKEKALIESVLSKKDQLEKSGSVTATLGYEDLDKLLTRDELEVAKKTKGINPKDYGFNGPFLGLFPVPKDLVKIENQKYRRNKEEITIPTQFVPEEAHRAYTDMNKKSKKRLVKVF
jgi:hypothetical protein